MSNGITHLQNIADAFERAGIPAQVFHSGGGVMTVCAYQPDTDYRDSFGQYDYVAMCGGGSDLDDPYGFDLYSSDEEYVYDYDGAFLPCDATADDLVACVALAVVFTALRASSDRYAKAAA